MKTAEDAGVRGELNKRGHANPEATRVWFVETASEVLLLRCVLTISPAQRPLRL